MTDERFDFFKRIAGEGKWVSPEEGKELVAEIHALVADNERLRAELQQANASGAEAWEKATLHRDENERLWAAGRDALGYMQRAMPKNWMHNSIAAELHAALAANGGGELDGRDRGLHRGQRPDWQRKSRDRVCPTRRTRRGEREAAGGSAASPQERGRSVGESHAAPR